MLGNLAKETVRAKKKHQTTALRAPHNMQHSFGKPGNAVCLHSSCVLRCKLQTSAFCNHCEYEYYFFSCGAKHAVAGTLFGCMAGNNVATSGALFKNPKMFVKYTCNLGVILKFSAGLLRRV